LAADGVMLKSSILVERGFMRSFSAAVFTLAVSCCAFGQAYTYTTVAGTFASPGYTGDFALATSAQLNYPWGVAVDTAGNVYIADSYNNVIRRVTASSGVITTVAGNGTQGYSGDNVSALSTELNFPTGVAVDAAGNLYIADYFNYRIRKVSNGVITTVAGTGVTGYGGDNGQATSALLGGPEGVAVDSAGNLYIADALNYRIRKVSGGIITTVAGNGTPGFSGDNGPATSAQLRTPYGVAVDSAGNLYIADTDNNRIREVSKGTIATVAGTGTSGYSGDNGPATSAQLHSPWGVAVDSAGNLYVADLFNNAIRRISNGVIATVAGGGGGFNGGGPANGILVDAPNGVAVSSAGNIYIADTDNQRVLELFPPPTVTASTLPAGTVGTAYLQTLSAGGGVAPYHNWVLSSGALPPGLTLDANAGTIGGVPASAAGSPYAFSVIVKDSLGNVSPALSFSISINQPAALTIITASPLPAGAVGEAYFQTFTATGGTAPYTNWTITAGSLPPGTSLLSLGYCTDPVTGKQLPAGCSLYALLGGTLTTAGTYTFTLQVTDTANATATKQFSLTINPAGTISITPGGIVNSASYAGGGVSPGEVVTIFGSGLGPSTPAGLQLDANGNVATSLGGVQILFGSVLAPLIYVQASQASAVVPYEVAGQTATQIQVLYQGQNSNLYTVPVVAAAPGIFTLNYSGSGPGTVLNQDGTVNSANNPAAVGSLVSVFATGEGQTKPGGVDGVLDGSPAPQPAQVVTATIGGVNATVKSAGGVTGAVAGILEVVLQVPATLASGSVAPVVLNIGGATSQTGVTLAIKAAQ
jgi:uncharacterized protein (TIGR03437 family)